jgi:oligopeptide/dipeptide ABC transporter ATP-binding protein
MKLLEIENLHVTYPAKYGRPIPAVRGVSVHVAPGESVGLVGESGSGKSSIAKAVVGLVVAEQGLIHLKGHDITNLTWRAWQPHRTDVQMVFQDPFGSLNPRLTVQACLEEALRAPGRLASVPENLTVASLLGDVGLSPAHAHRYPHELSGGQRQRIGIARALAVRPSLLIADEPVSALDVSVQVQVLNLLRDLQARHGLSLLIIAHDLAVVHYVCKRALVLYMGQVVEEGETGDLFHAPAHPYTEALVSAVPDVDRALGRRGAPADRILLQGDMPSAAEGIPGCPFHPRCHRAQPLCAREVPPLRKLERGRRSACHVAEDVIRSHHAMKTARPHAVA